MPCEENQEGKLSCKHILDVQRGEKRLVAKCNTLVGFRVQILSSVLTYNK